MELIVAVALVLVLEGALYALFPDGMKRMMSVVMEMPSDKLRVAGLTCATTGVALAWVIQRLLA